MHRCHQRQRLRFVPRGNGARRFRDRGPVHRPDGGAGEKLFRTRLRGPRERGAPHLSPARRRLRNGRARQRDQRAPGGTYLAMEGPQFSTLAESRMYRESWGADVIGMTNMPEAKLAREAELCYASVAMITDYDSWHPDHGEVDVSQIIATLMGNADKARDMVGRLPGLLGTERAPCPHGCDRALEYAIITQPDARDPAMMAKLDAVAGRVL
ncbi:hypothetical protein [Sulfitobacter alexandrii]|uniref:phosphorylase family protein n=1 Tax=Sulfitobacter alexandrii TaxID=1917485 RepID=UPI00202A1B6F|nr:hypothetical protein [Sulfitobacter alexandrii]